MTEEESAEFNRVGHDAKAVHSKHAEEYRWLLSKGFDLYNGINEGWALNKTKKHGSF